MDPCVDEQRLELLLSRVFVVVFLVYLGEGEVDLKIRTQGDVDDLLSLDRLAKVLQGIGSDIVLGYLLFSYQVVGGLPEEEEVRRVALNDSPSILHHDVVDICRNRVQSRQHVTALAHLLEM